MLPPPPPDGPACTPPVFLVFIAALQPDYDRRLIAYTRLLPEQWEQLTRLQVRAWVRPLPWRLVAAAAAAGALLLASSIACSLRAHGPSLWDAPPPPGLACWIAC